MHHGVLAEPKAEASNNDVCKIRVYIYRPQSAKREEAERNATFIALSLIVSTRYLISRAISSISAEFIIRTTQPYIQAI